MIGLLCFCLILGGASYALLYVKTLRLRLLSRPFFAYFKRVLPPLSKTEREAMEAGTVWWDADLFSGDPDWRKLQGYGHPALSAEEQAFLTQKVDPLLAQLNDFDILHKDKDLPPAVWQFLRENGFFALNIPKEYGGLGFSHYANSTIVTRIASRCLSAAVTVMVPNSLGPGELLQHYGTPEQKAYWLPRLARGEELPCFALTGPEAGSDAGSIPDTGVLCQGQWQGQPQILIRLNWNKRYITLAPRASVLGLAFKLADPEHLMGEQEEYGITCALIPTSHPGVHIGRRHFPMGQVFLNGPTQGQDVLIPLDWIIGGWAYAGKGWRMLVECLSAGRGISLPALGTACGHVATLTTSAYGVIRRQFGMPIGRFEGVQEALARITALTWQLEACRRLTTTGLDLGARPGIVTAIAKYQMTELARILLLDAMDVHAGRAVQWGQSNYLASLYMGIPIAITVEGANILTRSLMIFGQGATRCHPFVYQEMQAAADPNPQAGLQQFDRLLQRHLLFFLRHLGLSLFAGLTGGRLESSPVTGPESPYYRQLKRLSRVLVLCTDIAMLTLGGELKRREMLSARLGDVLSQLYLASAALKYYADEGRPASDRPCLDYALQRALFLSGQALEGFFANFPWRWLGWGLKHLSFPLGIRYRLATDQTVQQVCQQIQQVEGLRSRITALCYYRLDESDPVGRVELAYRATLSAQALERMLQEAQKRGQLPTGLKGSMLYRHACQAGVICEEDAAQLLEADRLRSVALQVDSFAPGELERLS